MTTFVADMHYGALLGLGYTANDFGSVSTTTVTSNVAADSYTIPVSGNFGMNPDILAVYLAADGEWHSFRIISSTATLIYADRPLKAITAGSTVSNAYVNDAHPNVNGGAMIVDDAIRQLTSGKTQELEKKQRECWSVNSGASINYTPVASYTYVGSDNSGERAAVVTGSGVGSVVSPSTMVNGGDYQINVPINSGYCSGPNSVVLSLEEQQPDTTWSTIVAKTYSGINAGYMASLNGYVQGDKPVRIKATCYSGSAWTFTIGEVDYIRCIDITTNFNTGKHVLFGDSWTTPGSSIATRLAARLPGATVVAKGIGGNRADQLISRFSSDVAIENPNFVWVIVGTNDYYNNENGAPTFDGNIATLKSLILGINATPIFLTPSVGAITYSPPKMFPSRRFHAYTLYHDLTAAGPSLADPWRSIPIYRTLDVPPAGSTVFKLPGISSSDAYIKYISGDNSNLILSLDNRVFNGGKTHRKWWTKRSGKSPVELKAVNNTGSTQTITVSAEVLWKGDMS